MSVRGEVERYLSALIASLRQRGAPGDANTSAQLAVLLGQSECKLSKRAQSARDALAEISFSRDEDEQPSDAPEGHTDEFDEALDSMLQLIRVILGS